MEAAGVCELDVATRRIVGGNDSPPELDSPCQVSVARPRTPLFDFTVAVTVLDNYRWW